jgi:hypothetical protein
VMRMVHLFMGLSLFAGACGSTDRVAGSTAALALCPDAGPAAPDVCLFGEVFSDVRTSSALAIDSERWIRAVDDLDALAAEQLLRAVQQSSHNDVVTAEEALARVDQQEVRVIALRVRSSGRAFAVYEYGVGDNSYGAYFEQDGTEVVASIHDGDVLDCSVFDTPALDLAFPSFF